MAGERRVKAAKKTLGELEEMKKLLLADSA